MTAMDVRHARTRAQTRPLRRDAERNRLLILAAARIVFARRGFDASLDEVAREAGLGVGTVYRRFPNRDALIDALLAEGVASIERVLDEAKAMPRAWDGLCHFMASMLELQARDKGLRDVLALRHVPDVEHDVVRDLVKPVLHELVALAQAEGDLRADLTPTDVAVLEVAALGAAEFTAPAGPDVWRRYLTIMLDGMRAGSGDLSELTEHPPLDDEQAEACMVGWRYGSRETPRQRPKPSA